MKIFLEKQKKQDNKEVIPYKILFETYKDKVYRVAYYIVKNEHDAKDIVQEAFITAYRKMSSLKDPNKFESWICTIASNLAKEKYMKNKRELLIDDYDNVVSLSNNRFNLDTVEDKIEKKELNKEIMEQIHSLDSHYREVILLYYYMNLSYAEIAQTLNIKEGTVKSRVSRAKNLIKDKIIKNNISDYYITYGKSGK